MSRTEELLKADAAHLWHPFTQMKLWPDEPPLVIERGEGNYLYDSEGRRYFDGVSSLWVTVHGHNHPRIVQAIADQAARLDHSTLLGLTHPLAVELAARLCDIAPDPLNKAFYSESGSTAVEIALKIAFQYWQQSGRPGKKTFVALDQAYHGDTLGSGQRGRASISFTRFISHMTIQDRCTTCRCRIFTGAAPRAAGTRNTPTSLVCAEALKKSSWPRVLVAHLAALVVEPSGAGRGRHDCAGLEGILKRRLCRSLQEIRYPAHRR